MTALALIVTLALDVLATPAVTVEREMGWQKLLAYVTVSVHHGLLLHHEYLVTGNLI